MGKEFDWYGQRLTESDKFSRTEWNIFETHENALTAAKKARIAEQDIWHTGVFYAYNHKYYQPKWRAR